MALYTYGSRCIAFVPAYTWSTHVHWMFAGLSSNANQRECGRSHAAHTQKIKNQFKAGGQRGERKMGLPGPQTPAL